MTKVERRKARRKNTIATLQETGVYFAAALGVLVSRWWGPYRSGTLKLSDFAGAELLIEVVGAMIGGFMVQAILLDRGGLSAGKRARWKERAGQAFLGGIAIDYIIGEL